jgi:response regulator RpfG family c-di-GMP phosphodiesterase
MKIDNVWHLFDSIVADVIILDGSGYPPVFLGRITAAGTFAVVDVWDTLQSDRPYCPAWSDEKVIQCLKKESGKHFDSGVVDTFFELIGKH